MSTLSTPSAKAHERVTGRWLRDIEVTTRKDWLVFYAKRLIGSPIPFLFTAVLILTAFSRAGIELTSWLVALLTCFYILADRFARTREFRFFRIGADFFLLGLVLVGLIGALTSSSISLGVATIGDLRWIFLLYAFTYCWELFPGLNRMFQYLIGAATIGAGYGLWQHFTGVDAIGGSALPDAPIARSMYFIPIGFLGSPEAFGTLLATLIPFPAAVLFFSEKRDSFAQKWVSLAIVLILSLALFWTYRPGLWMAGGIGLIVTMLMKARNGLTLLLSMAAMIAVVTFTAYDNPSAMLDGVQASETVRAENQRKQINTQVELWQKSTLIGVGHEASEAANYDPSTGNVYFHLLAQFGVFGATFYLLFVLTFLLGTYRIYQEIPSTHVWHRALIAAGLGAQIAFHTCGLYWVTFAEALMMNLFVVLVSAMSYLSEHYSRGLVSDDTSL